MTLVKKFCVVRNDPIFTSEGSDFKLNVIKEFETLEQITSYYREEDENPNDNHPLFPKGARVIEIFVPSREPTINI